MTSLNLDNVWCGSKDEAKESGFGGYNGGMHLCVDLSDTQNAEHYTISVKTHDGQLVTFAFCPRVNKIGHQCVDIHNHSGPKNDSGTPLQSVMCLGQGDTPGRFTTDDGVTTTVLLFPEQL